MKKEKKVKEISQTAEMTFTSVVIGIIIAVVFGGVNAYLGLRVGMTVSASIPAAVISMGIIRVLMKRDSILENNIVQTIGSAGESLAAGAIVTIPALFMWAGENGDKTPEFWKITLVSICGGLLGVLFMVPLRDALIVKEDGKLPYPEGTACAEVLAAGNENEKKSSVVFKGLFVAAVYKFLTDGMKLFPSEIHSEIKRIKGAGIGADVLPALLSVGYICGKRISGYMFAGGILSWLGIMPLIALFGASNVIYPGINARSDMSTQQLWSVYIRYIGAGAVAVGGVISLFKSIPVIMRTFSGIFRTKGYAGGEQKRTQRQMSMSYVMLLVGLIIIFMWLTPAIPIGFFGAIIIGIFGFFFATVSSRMVGMVGSSNNPVSGMAIATLLVSTAILKSTGNTGYAGMMASIYIGTVICIIAAMAGDTSQDLKTGYIVGATPLKQQIGEIIGVVCAGLTVGGVMYLLDAAWGFGSTQLPAPQATLMKVIVEGVMEGNLPWAMVFSGGCIAVALEVIGIPVLPVAVGMYLPVNLSVPIFIGGLIRWGMEKRRDKDEVDNGVLFSSGMIAGEGLVGILTAIFAIIPYGKGSVEDVINLNGIAGETGAILAFAVLILIFVFSCRVKKEV